MSHKIAGNEPGQRQLNGPQTTGREYRNLSQPEFEITRDNDVAAPMRDGIELLVDVYRPKAPGRYPVLIAASPYPRQIQDLGAPLGFIEAGTSDFFVPRGYVHVIANLRGTGGSGGTFSFFDSQERQDMYDLVEWAAAQPWSDGNVGMIGISYFAMTQLEAAVENPPHLKAIFPLAATVDLYDAAMHHGLMSAAFLTPFLYMVGLTSGGNNKLWRSTLLTAVRKLLHEEHIHKKFATMNGEAAIGGLKLVLKLPHNPHPWDDLWRSVAVEHPLRDEWWDGRNLHPLLNKINIPVYMGCDWQNVPLHLPSTLASINNFSSSPHLRVAMMGENGLTWPWESLHIENLAWFDQWLKGRDTGIVEGPMFRYVLPGGNEGWHTTPSWPPADTNFKELSLRADGILSEEEGKPGSRTYMTLGAGLNRPQPSPTDPASCLVWQSAPLDQDLDVIGEMELRLDAIITASDTAWIVIMQDLGPDGQSYDVTGGYLRASLREVDETASRLGAPVLSCRKAELVPIGETVNYRIPLVPNARHFQRGHCIRIMITSDDQSKEMPALLEFRHASVGTSSLNKVLSSSRLVLPVAY